MIVGNFSTSNGVAIDGFSIKTIKTIIPYIAEQLADIFNKLIVSGVFPDSLKHVNRFIAVGPETGSPNDTLVTQTTRKRDLLIIWSSHEWPGNGPS